MGSQASADSFSDLAGTTAGLLAQLGHAPSAALDGADAPPPALAPGTTIGDNFEVVERLGAGGMAVVYLARDRQLDRPVAIKLQRRPSDRRGLSRALREAMAMARLSHPNVLTVHEIGELGPRMYIVTEHVDGWNAREWVARERPGSAAIVDLYLRAGEGLAAAHAVGIVHRDFKPDNVLVGRDGRVRVADFGLARVEPQDHDDDDATGTTAEPASALAHRVTADGAIAGTLAYMPPEQRAGAPVDARADQFAFCVALHEALTGALPDALPDARPDGAARLPGWLDRVLRRGRDPEPTRRFPSMPALLAALRRDARAARNRRLGRAAAALLGGLGITTAAGVFDRPQLCVDAGAPLHGVWDEPRREALAAAFTRACAGAPGTCPEGLVTRTRALLDEYARAWAAARTAGCEATHVYGVQSAELLDRRMSCLDERLRALDARVGVLLGADADAASEAPNAAASLPSLAACADPNHLMARLAPPEDPALEAAVAAARRRIAEADALLLAGGQKAALAVLEPLTAEAAALAYAPLQAEVALELGELKWQTDPSASEAHLLDAHFLAVAHDHDEVAASAAIALVWNSYVQSRADAGALWSRHALAATERRGTDAALRSEALNAVASLHSEQGRLAEALALQDQALARTPPGGVVWASLVNNRAATLDALGRYAEARAGYEQVLAEERRIYGDVHPRIAATYANLGLVRMRQGLPAEAVQLQRLALQIFDATRGPEHGARWPTLLNLGIALLADDRPAEAMTPIDEALAAATRVLGPDHPDVALCLSARASALQRADRPAEAIAPATQALAMLERSYGPEHAEVLVQQSLLGQILAAAGRHDEALVSLTRAVAGWDARDEHDHPSLAEALVEQGELLRRAGRGDEARAAFTRALAIAGRGEVSAALVERARAGLQPAP